MPWPQDVCLSMVLCLLVNPISAEFRLILALFGCCLRTEMYSDILFCLGISRRRHIMLLYELTNLD